MQGWLAITYSMLGQNGRTPPTAPQPDPMAPPQPDAKFELRDFNFDDSEFDAWNEAFVADAVAKAAKEVA
jgi:hypothetical protein